MLLLKHCSSRDKAPGQKECDSAIETLTALMKELDQTAMLNVSQNLAPRRENTLQGFTDQVQTAVNEIGEKLPALKTAAKYQAENVGHAVCFRFTSIILHLIIAQ